MAHGYENLEELVRGLDGVVAITDDRLIVESATTLRRVALERLRKTATSSDGPLRTAAQWVLWAASQALGCGVGSARGLIDSMEREEVTLAGLPTIELGNRPYPVARAAFRAAGKIEAGPVLLATPLPENGELASRLAGRVATVLAAAIMEEWRLPVLLLGLPVAGSADLAAQAGWAVEQGVLNVAVPRANLAVDAEVTARGGIAPAAVEGVLNRCDAVEIARLVSDLEDASEEALVSALAEQVYFLLDNARARDTVELVRRHIIPRSTPRRIPPELARATETG